MWINLSRHCEFFFFSQILYICHGMHVEVKGKCQYSVLLFLCGFHGSNLGLQASGAGVSAFSQWSKPLAWHKFYLRPWSVCVWNFSTFSFTSLQTRDNNSPCLVELWSPNEKFTNCRAQACPASVPRKWWTAPAFLRHTQPDCIPSSKHSFLSQHLRKLSGLSKMSIYTRLKLLFLI